ncbi:hypothetical protein L226DRAFT_66829 [Lentinus tigrinus ALCF2SS1-7]|uniref:Uncharacterized protein n=1 Tax=Lentinus tigrinus ALCF2SS1-6 TaxID=1328759 RepID=A0A5C2S8C3_9APHY|nr:hypothetical protein L227DRAFT_107538 [Lentinus tigrinus ALCF2SS1-6]RPD74836.1 hypothetical protein L226DRAFT_66829 [Lentinus tigrinus ALCF2SS1-7]
MPTSPSYRRDILLQTRAHATELDDFPGIPARAPRRLQELSGIRPKASVVVYCVVAISHLYDGIVLVGTDVSVLPLISPGAPGVAASRTPQHIAWPRNPRRTQSPIHHSLHHALIRSPPSRLLHSLCAPSNRHNLCSSAGPTCKPQSSYSCQPGGGVRGCRTRSGAASSCSGSTHPPMGHLSWSRDAHLIRR